jgi:hypothetical protein
LGVRFVLTIAARQAAGMLRGRSFWVLTALGAALVAVGAYRVIVPAGNLGELRLDQTTHPLRADADPPRHWTEIRRVSQQNIPSGKARNCGSRRNCAPQRVIAVFQCTIDPSRADDIGHAFLALASVVATGP